MPVIGRSSWKHEPPYHERSGETLVVRTGKEKDYWNNTFYGFRHLDGHFLATEVSGDFSAELTFSANYRNLYDQAGAMLWVDENNWLKCGVEFTDGALHFSVVITRDDQSDWSVMPLDRGVDDGISLRLTRHGEALRVQLETGNGEWRLVRLGFLRMPAMVEAGPMTCSPTSEGLEVRFEAFRISEPVARELHE